MKPNLFSENVRIIIPHGEYSSTTGFHDKSSRPMYLGDLFRMNELCKVVMESIFGVETIQ